MPKFLTSINLTKNELQNAALHNLGSAPSSPVLGQVYFNSTTGDKKPYIWNGTTWVDLSQQNTDTITRLKGGASGTLVSGDINLLAGSNISITQSGNDITVTGASGSLTFTGDVTGTGTTGGSTTLTLANSGVTAGTYKSVTVDTKGRVTAGTNPTTLSGYGITDAQPLDADLTAIAGLSGTSGFLKTNGAGVWSVDTNTYLTSNISSAVSITNTTDATSSSSGGALTISGGLAVAKKLYVGSDLVVTGNLTINGTTTTINSTTITTDDVILTLGGDTAPATDDNKDRGIEFRWHNGTAAKSGFFGFDDSTGYFTFIPDATNSSEVFSGTPGDIQATNFRGALIGNASTATKLATARTISISSDAVGSVSFDGSANATIALTLANSGVTAGTYGGWGESAVITVDSKGRVTSATTALITPYWESIQGKPYIVGKYTTTIGNGTDTSILIDFYGTIASSDVVLTVKDSSTGEIVYPDVVFGNGTATLSFSIAPASGQYTVVVVG